MAELENTVEVQDTPETEVEQPAAPDNNAEIERLKKELAAQIKKNDTLAKENKDQKAQIRASKTAEEQKAEEEREAREAVEKELAELRKERAVANNSKKVYTFIQDEAIANAVAANLYGAEDVDSAIDAISKAWAAREKALKLEYGKIAAPSAGVSAGPTVTKAELDAMPYMQRLKFAKDYPDEYAKLMGRA
jgi:hypothetical protein